MDAFKYYVYKKKGKIVCLIETFQWTKEERKAKHLKDEAIGAKAVWVDEKEEDWTVGKSYTLITSGYSEKKYNIKVSVPTEEELAQIFLETI